MKKLLLILLTAIPWLATAQAPISVAERPLYDKKSIGEIRINFTNKNWSDALDSLRIYGEEMLTASVTIDGQRYEGVGVRYRGDKSYQLGLKRNPFSIKLNYANKEQAHQGYTSLKISSALRDPSMVREVLFYEIANVYMPAPQICYTKIYVNDENIGVFINVESIGGKFLKDHFGSDDNPIFKAGVEYKPKVPTSCKINLNGSLEFEDNVECYKANFEMSSASGWIDLQDFTRTLNADVRAVSRALDVDRALWMLALNNVMVNLNSYTGTATNYYLYEDNFNRFQPIHWDLNLCFGGYKNTGTGSDLELKDLQRLDPLLHAENPYRPLIKQLLSDPLNKKIYLAHIRQIIDENFKNGSYEKRAQELQAMIVIPFTDDKYKTYSVDEFQKSLKETVGRRSKIPGIVELMDARTKYLDDHAELTFLKSNITEISNVSRGKFEAQRLEGFRVTAKADRFPKRLWLYYRLQPNAAFTALPMEEEPAKNLASGTKLYGANVDTKNADTVLEYYILAENTGTVSYAPANYTQKTFKIKLSELNK